MPTIVISAEMERLFDEEFRAAMEHADRRERCLDEHGYGCARAECGRGPAVVRGLAEFTPRSRR